jgi:formylglycine-generating enzyme required for sulfatase activity
MAGEGSNRHMSTDKGSDISLLLLRAEDLTDAGKHTDALVLYRGILGQVIGADLHEEVERRIAELEGILQASDKSEEADQESAWVCPECHGEVGIQERICPFCERGLRDGTIAPDLKRYEGDGQVRKERFKWLLIGAGLTLIIVVISALGFSGILSDRWLEPSDAQTLVTGAVIEMEASAEPATARLTETPTATAAQTSTPSLTPTITQTPTSTSGVGSSILSEIDGMKLVYVPEGAFQRLESGGGHYRDEIILNGFWIDQTEVTNAMFIEFLNAEGNQEEGGAMWLDAEDADAQIEIVNGEWQAMIKPDHPVVEITWYGAAAYCEWAGRRLPTFAEWEKASRGEDGNLYPWGNEEPNCTLANYKVLGSNSECRGETSRVGAYPDGASPYGALDTAGNVWEWVADWFGEDYYSNSPSEPPLKPSSGSLRTLIGGSWIWLPSRLFVWNNRLSIPEGSYYDGGFRCALSP